MHELGNIDASCKRNEAPEKSLRPWTGPGDILIVAWLFQVRAATNATGEAREAVAMASPTDPTDQRQSMPEMVRPCRMDEPK